MPRPAHTLVTYQGVIGPDNGEVEAFSFSLRCIGAPDGGITDYNARAIAAMGAFSDNMITRIGDNVALTKVTVASVQANGLWAQSSEGAYVKGEWTGEVRSGTLIANDPYCPAQAALVLSLSGNRAGASGKGRVFLPVGRAALDASGRITGAGAQGYATAAAGWIADLNTVEGDVSVVSSKGFSTKVTQVRVGRVIDTMRSRRRDIVEEYKTASVPT